MSEYRRKTFIENIKCECYRVNKAYLIGIPLILILLAAFTRWVSGSPIPTLHYIGAKEIVLPVWLMVLLFCVFYVIAGLELGFSLGNRFCPFTERKYQGAMWFCICIAISLAWYPIFFCARLFLVSLIASALCLFSAICATICFAQVSSISFSLAIVYDAWLLYLLFLNMQIFFAI